MRHILASLFCVLPACAPGDTTTEPLSTPEAPSSLTVAWAPPVTGASWKKDFNVVNPTLLGNSTCFGKPMNQLVHSGEDWGNSAGTPVFAIGAGTVVYAAPSNYPGAVIVIRHSLMASERAALGVSTSTIYSQYAHLDQLFVNVNDTVTAGQKIATVLDQGSNSHLHWEVRTVQIPQLCQFIAPGPGYTDAGTDARLWGYLSPSASVAALASAGPGTCDNNVPIGGTACNPADPAAQFVCANPSLPSPDQWTRVACPAGQLCSGTACAPTTACPFGSIQARVQQNVQQPWSPAITIALGQRFIVGAFHDGSGELTDCCTAITVTGPGGFFKTPGNNTKVNPPTVGTYQVTVTCGAKVKIATVTVQ